MRLLDGRLRWLVTPYSWDKRQQIEDPTYLEASPPKCRGIVVTYPSHRHAKDRHQVWPPGRLIGWSASFGPSVVRVVELTLARYGNPEQGYRACLGLMRTAQRDGPERMNAPCERALSVGTHESIGAPW